MSQEIKPFLLESSCIKCGCFHEPQVKYQEGLVTPFKEYLLRTCKYCGYFWREMSLDRNPNYYEEITYTIVERK